jgi:starch phosphorylase
MDYSNMFYVPALKNYRRMVKDVYTESKSLAGYMVRVKQSWGSLKIVKLESNAKPVMQRGDSLTVTAFIELGPLSPNELQVELYYGSVSSHSRDIQHANRAEMRYVGHEGTLNKFHVKIECVDTGWQGHTVRILPKHDALVHPYRPGFIRWA